MLTVFCDFDGTITTRDVVNTLLAELADPAWQALERDWEQGRIGSRECLARQIPLIRGGWPAIERVLSTIELDPTFAPFAAFCAAAQIQLVIVSDGLDRVIRWLLLRDGLTVDGIWANQLVIGTDGALSVRFPYPPRDRACWAGLCKCQVLDRAVQGRIVVGDGLSDVCWASRADRCFAKGQLLASCRAQQIPCEPFDDFSAIQRALASTLAESTTASLTSSLAR